MGIQATLSWLQHVHETGSLALAAHVNTGLPRTLQTPTSEDTIIEDVKQELGRSAYDITEEFRLSQLRVFADLKISWKGLKQL
jgi:hypothetical protein